MADSKIPSETTLNLAVERAVRLLSAVAYNPHIYAALAARGYNETIQAHGWELVHAVTGFRRPLGLAVSAAGKKALEEVDAWDEPNFNIAHAALDFEFPEQSAFIFEDLVAATGPAALLTVKTFLDRRDALKNGTERPATREQDTAAVAKLAARGIDDAECARLRALLTAAQAPANPEKPVESPNRDPAETLKAKIALHGWVSEWREIASQLIKRRDYLFQLGLAERKVKKKNKKDGSEEKKGDKKDDGGNE